MKKLTFSLIGFVFLLFALSANAAGLGEDCIVDADCDDIVYCNGIESCSSESSICVEGEPVDCGEGFCDDEKARCVECYEDIDCVDNATPFCSDALDCVECYEDFDCTDNDTPYCGDMLECVQCLDDLDCEDNETCQLGACVDTASCGLFIKPPFLNLKKGVKPVKQMFTIKGVKGEEGFDPDGEIDFGPCEIIRTCVAGNSDVLKVQIIVPDNATFEEEFIDVRVGTCTGQVFLGKSGSKGKPKKKNRLNKQEQKELEQAEKEAEREREQAEKELEQAEKEAEREREQAEKELEQAEKEAEREREQAEKELEQAEKEAEKEREQAEKEAEKAEREAERENKKAEKEANKNKGPKK